MSVLSLLTPTRTWALSMKSFRLLTGWILSLLMATVTAGS